MSTLQDGHPNVKAAIAAMGNSEMKKKTQRKQKGGWLRDDGTAPSQKATSSTVGKRKELPKDTNKTHHSLSSRNPRVTEELATKGRKYKDPLNKRLRDVIACLLETREDLSKEEICQRKKLDVDDTQLWEEVQHNPRIEVLADTRKFRYRPRNPHVTHRESLLMHVRRHTRGTQWNEISDSYQSIDTDMKILIEEKKLFVIENPDIEDKVIFWNDTIVESVSLSADIAELWEETRAPSDSRTHEELMKKAGIAPAQRKISKKREPIQKISKERAPRKPKFRKITNVHMPELFNSDQPDQID